MTQNSSRLDPLKRWTFAAPVILVNIAGLVGQSMWFLTQISGPNRPLAQHPQVAIITALLFGIALESISIYLALQAHSALLAGQASGGLRFGSYAVAAVVAGLNYHHFTSTHAQALGVSFALFSLVSPWLWAIDSKSAYRSQLAEQGIVDPRGVRLSTVRKLLHPIRSWRVIRWASWAGETHPERAVSGWENGQSAPIHAESLPILSPIQEGPPIQEEATESTDEVQTVTETVTRTETRSVSVSRHQKRIERLRERVQIVKDARPDWETKELTYDDIRSVLGLTGAEVIKPVYAVLYRGETVESVLLAN